MTFGPLRSEWYDFRQKERGAPRSLLSEKMYTYPYIYGEMGTQMGFNDEVTLSIHKH